MTRRPLSTVGLVLTAALLGACGGKDRAGADTSGVAPVGTYQAAADSAVAGGKATIDSLKQAGQTPAAGLDSAAARTQIRRDSTVYKTRGQPTPPPARP